MLSREREKMRARLHRLQLASKVKQQKENLKKFHAEQKTIRECALAHIRLIESIEKPLPTVATNKPHRTTQYRYDMMDYVFGFFGFSFFKKLWVYLQSFSI